MISFLAIAAIGAVPVARRIQPGMEIGHVFVGQLAPNLLGPPTYTDGAAGSIWSTWKAADGNTLDIFAQLNMAGTGHAVVYARVTSDWFRTAHDIHTHETWGHIKAHFPGTNIKTYHSKQFGRNLSIMDDKAAGISFEVTLSASQHVTNHSKCVAIWVHTAGTAFDPNQWVNYEPTRP